MMTRPATCRFRKLGCPVTAKVRIAPMASKVRQLAVLICHPSDESYRAGTVPRDAAGAILKPANLIL